MEANEKGHLAICPFCDNEQRVRTDREVSMCGRCGKPFNTDLDMSSHPEEFWANPETSARF